MMYAYIRARTATVRALFFLPPLQFTLPIDPAYLFLLN